MRVVKRYCDTAAGQVHLRECGSGDALVLLHWAPASGRMYEHLMPRFAALGYRALAFDVYGYGRSDKEDEGWSIADYASNLGEAMRAIGAWPAHVVGGHLSAAIACELAIAEPNGVRGLVLDGSPAWTPEQRTALFARFAGLSPKLDPSGSHKTFAWDMIERSLMEWDDRFRVTEATLPLLYEYVRDFYETGLKPKPALMKYEMLARLGLLRVPVLALTAETEPLRPTHAAVLERVPGVREHCFPGAHPLLDPARAGDYVGVIDAFVRAVPSERRPLTCST
jgi:pimeloyl-ACP methyl ester carboxylesterase